MNRIRVRKEVVYRNFSINKIIGFKKVMNSEFMDRHQNTVIKAQDEMLCLIKTRMYGWDWVDWVVIEMFQI